MIIQDVFGGFCGIQSQPSTTTDTKGHEEFDSTLQFQEMRFVSAISVVVLICGFAGAQQKTSDAERSVTVPAVIDHNRVVINVEISLPDRSQQKIRAWVDNGNPDLYLSRRVATLLGLDVSCSDKECSSLPPKEISIGGMKIPLDGIKKTKIPLRPVSAAAVLALGMNAEMNIPSNVLRHYDVLVDFPEHKFSIGQPGSIRFLGSSTKVLINSENGLIEVPSTIENKKYNLGLDLGACISFLSEDLFDKLAIANPDWPHMTGAVGSANMWGADEETNWKVMRLDRLQFGPLFLTDVAIVSLPKAIADFLEKRAGTPTVGILGSNVMLNYRVGLDYAKSMVYFDIGRLFNFPDFDVIGLVLRPENDGRYTILGVADFEGKPSVDGVQAGDSLLAVDGIPVHGATMGQVWSMLGGTSGQERAVTIERGGKEFHIVAHVQHFLAALPEPEGGKKRRK